MEDVVHLIVFDEIDECGEELGIPSNDFPGRQNILLEDKG